MLQIAACLWELLGPWIKEVNKKAAKCCKRCVHVAVILGTAPSLTLRYITFCTGRSSIGLMVFLSSDRVGRLLAWLQKLHSSWSWHVLLRGEQSRGAGILFSFHVQNCWGLVHGQLHFIIIHPILPLFTAAAKRIGPDSLAPAERWLQSLSARQLKLQRTFCVTCIMQQSICQDMLWCIYAMILFFFHTLVTSKHGPFYWHVLRL